MTTPNATEREIARAFVRGLARTSHNRVIFDDEIEAGIEQLLADRREACARKAEGFTCGSCGMDSKVGAAIRDMQD